MRPLDWVVLVTTLFSIVAYGLYRSRGSNTVDRYLLAGKSMPWYAMALSIIVISAIVVPVFHHARVYTAYEYLENRFDSKTRALASIIFLCQRGLSAGLTLYAPAIVLSVILGWPERMTTIIMGVTVVT